MTTTAVDIDTQASRFRLCFDELRAELARTFVGQPAIVDQLLLCFFCQGHGLIEGAPGLGKTLLVKTLSEALNLRFARIQCTPDLMPADVTGTNVLLETSDGVRSFVFQRDPIFANVVLADEINRATPRAQSAFLEAMQERHVTSFGQTYELDQPFSVFATQNPIEMEGTYPLPEAQLDRFFFKMIVDAPTVDDMVEIMARTTGDQIIAVNPRFGTDTVRTAHSLIRHVKIADPVLRYVLRLVRATHPDAAEAPPIVRRHARYGASPRGAQAMVLAAKALALLAGRYHVAVEDIQQVVRPALNHRVIRNFQAAIEQVTADQIVAGVVAATPEP